MDGRAAGRSKSHDCLGPRMTESGDVEPADGEGGAEEEEGLLEYVVAEVRRNPKESIAFVVFFLMFGGFLVVWWLSVALSR